MLLTNEDDSGKEVNSNQLSYELVDLDNFNNALLYADMTSKAADASMKDQHYVCQISEKTVQICGFNDTK